jgi:hypothetical protein
MNCEDLEKRFDAAHMAFYYHVNNEGRMTIDVETTMSLLTGLIDHPGFFSFIEEHLADELEQLGYFSLESFSVTALGRDFLSQHQRTG